HMMHHTGRSLRVGFRASPWVAAAAACIGLLADAKADLIVIDPPEWVAASGGNVPRNAVQVGTDTDGNILYACMARSGSGTYPGKLARGFAGCNIAVNGREITVPHYEVLVMEHPEYLDWAAVGIGGAVPSNAVEAGQDESRKPNYICAIKYQGSQQAGRTTDRYPHCNVGYGGRELVENSYSVLVRLTLPRRN